MSVDEALKDLEIRQWSDEKIIDIVKVVRDNSHHLQGNPDGGRSRNSIMGEVMDRLKYGRDGAYVSGVVEDIFTS